MPYLLRETAFLRSGKIVSGQALTENYPPYPCPSVGVAFSPGLDLRGKGINGVSADHLARIPRLLFHTASETPAAAISAAAIIYAILNNKLGR